MPLIAGERIKSSCCHDNFVHAVRMAAALFVAGALHRERVFRDRTHPLDAYDDMAFIQRYRLRRDQVLQLIAQYEVSKWGVRSSRSHAK